MYATHYYNMRRFVLLMMLLPLVVSCGRESKEDASEQTYAMLEQVAELSAGGNKQAALELADSALQMHPADSVRCWLMSEKTVALVDMGRMAEAVGVAHEAYELARKLQDMESMLNLCGSMGVAYRRQGKVDSALVQYKKGIELALKEHNAEYEIYLNNCVTVLYSESNRFAEAIQYAEKTERAAQEAGDTIERLSARANIGGVYLRQNKPQKALEAMLPCWQEVQAVGYNVLTLKFLSIILKSYSLLGNYHAVGEYMQYADRAMAGVAAGSNGALGILVIKADMLAAQGRYAEQLALVDSLIASGAQNQAMPMDRLLRMKAQCLERLGKQAEALDEMKEAYILLDSVKQSDIERSMSEFSVKYKTLETEKALAESKRKETELANQVLCLVMLTVSLLGLLCALLYRRRLAAQKAVLQERQSYISGLEDERERIAKELHDGVCNDILAAKLLFATDPSHAEGYLNEVWQNVRHLSHVLMPPNFQEVTLDVVTRSYVAAIYEGGKRNIKLDIDTTFDWHRLPQQVAYETYRIMQEGTANALKYGDGKGIDISLGVDDRGVLKLRIANGVDPESGHGQREETCGIGWQTLKKRADRIGALLSVLTENTRFVLFLSCKIKAK